MCSGGRSPAISVDFGSLWVATQSSWPAAGVLRHDTHIFLWMATLIVRRLSYRIRIFISENNDHTIIHFGKFVSYVFSEMLILRGKVVYFISENSYDTYFREIRMIRIFIFKIRIDTYFHYWNSCRHAFSCRHLFSTLGNSVDSFISPGPSTNPESSRPAAKHARVFLMALASKPYICRILVVHVCWSDVLEEFAWGSYRPCIVNTGP